MRKAFKFSIVAVLAAGAISMSPVRPAAADSAAATTSSVDCTQAESMLENAVKNKVPALMTGNIDKDFATIMMVHERVTKRINEIEAKCGKDPKTQALATKQAESSEQRMEQFRDMGSGTSQ